MYFVLEQKVRSNCRQPKDTLGKVFSLCFFCLCLVRLYFLIVGVLDSSRQRTLDSSAGTTKDTRGARLLRQLRRWRWTLTQRRVDRPPCKEDTETGEGSVFKRERRGAGDGGKTLSAVSMLWGKFWCLQPRPFQVSGGCWHSFLYVLHI